MNLDQTGISPAVGLRSSALPTLWPPCANLHGDDAVGRPRGSVLGAGGSAKPC